MTEDDIFTTLRQLRENPDTTVGEVASALNDAGLGEIANTLLESSFGRRAAQGRKSPQSDIFDRSRQRSDRLFGGLGQSRISGQSRLTGAITRQPSFGASNLNGPVTGGFERPRLQQRLAPQLQNQLTPKLPEILQPRLPDRLRRTSSTGRRRRQEDES